MKLIAICAILFTAALAEEVKPIYEFAEWWKHRGMTPPEWIKDRSRSARVVGGQEARRHQFPYQAGLRLSIWNGTHTNIGTCGGSLVTPNRVLTAAHCIDIVTSVESVLGAHFLLVTEPTQQRFVSDIFFWHEEYNPTTITNDVGIINLPTAATINAYVQVINLHPVLTDTFAGEIATLSGWGRFGPEQVISQFLRYLEAPVISNTLCRIRFPTIIQDSTICTSGDGNVGGCNGDSGGPLTVQRNGQSTVIGIASFVFGLGCDAGWPTAYARVTAFDPWIRSRL